MADASGLLNPQIKAHRQKESRGARFVKARVPFKNIKAVAGCSERNKCEIEKLKNNEVFIMNDTYTKSVYAGRDAAKVLAGRMKQIVDRAGSTLSDAEQEELDALGLAADSLAKTRLVPAGRIGNSDTGVDDGENSNLKVFRSAKDAKGFGLFCSAVSGSRNAEGLYEDLMQQPMISDTHREGDNAAGGYLVPEILSRQILSAVRDYGTFRENAQIVELTSESLTVPKRKTGLSVGYIGEGQQIPASVKQWQAYRLDLRKLAALAVISNELSEDAIVSVFDDLASEMSYAIAFAEDTAGFLGTGAAATGGIVGVVQRLRESGAAGNTVSINGGANWSAITVANLIDVVGLCGAKYLKKAAWYCTPQFYALMIRLCAGAGGTTLTELVNGVKVPQILGHPVKFAEVMPGQTAADSVPVVFGDLAAAALMGVSKSGFSLARSDSATIDGQNLFERNQQALRMISRYDIAVHSFGMDGEPSPVSMLKTS